ncbi:major capsid protein [Mycobacterium sp. OTB74]|jgi:hypothetical protein|uniref:major capsid protein n=1 Tax=Mycobacterium sp. OTB74 TaxID=1853452 RepID=UPI0024751117|nr:major capsid protein [Mycobacterium sp. OTB74]MDH6245747.1 hypothetical protein [Mycobacterium sp. OTB74]
MPSLIPTLSGRNLTVDYALNSPTLLRNRIARLADDLILAPKLLASYGANLQGGGMLYNVIASSDMFLATDVEARAPGSEYRRTEGVDPDPQLAVVQDWGASFAIADEQIIRNAINYLDQQITQLSNQLVRKLDTACVAAIEAAIASPNTVSGHSWSSVQIVGPLSTLTPSNQLPTADISAAKMAGELQELGSKYNLLIVHPEEANSLRSAYADKLSLMLESAGIEMFVSARLTAGEAWLCDRGNVGIIGFEVPLRVEVIPDLKRRQKIVQGYVVPAIGIDRPYNLKKITGLA